MSKHDPSENFLIYKLIFNISRNTVKRFNKYALYDKPLVKKKMPYSYMIGRASAGECEL